MIWEPIYDVIQFLLVFYRYALLIYIVMSWIPEARQSKFGGWLTVICEPYLSQFRKFIPSFGGIDFSPIIAFFALQFIERGIYFLFVSLF